MPSPIPELIISSLLILATLLSFHPQLRRLRTLRSTRGLSEWCVLLNLVVATYVLAVDACFAELGLGLLATSAGDESRGHKSRAGGGRDRRDARDWLNFCQFVAAWVGMMGIFIQLLALPPLPLKSKGRLAVLYTCFLVVMGVVIAISADGHKGHEVATAMLRFLGPLVQLAGLLALVLQARKTRSRGSAGALSGRGLVVQGGVFALVALSLVRRLRVPTEWWVEHPREVLPVWYGMVGWAVVNCAIFALEQGVLAGMVWRLREEEENEENGEGRALLGERE